AILRDVIRPSIAYVACLPANQAAVERRYRLEPGPQMVRMWVDKAAFRPVVDPGVERLVPTDAGELNRLYRLGFGSWLPPQAIANGVYYGIRVNGRLVAAAGTHVIGRAARIAVVGNVLTQPEFRGRGYAQATTTAVTARLLETCDHVVLNVRSDNPPALNAYRRLGFAEHVRFEERLGHRIGSLLADVAAALLSEYGIPVHARRGEDRDTYYRHLSSVADTHPTLTMDDGCDLVSLLHQDRAAQVKEVLAGTEETTTGVIRLRAMAADGA